MPLEEKIKEAISTEINKSYLTQESTIRGRFDGFSFSKSEIDARLKALRLDHKDNRIDRDTVYDLLMNPIFCDISDFLYESEDKGKKKIRELDFDLTFYTGGQNNKQICLTFIGDIKNNEKYKWVFSNKREQLHFFPFHWVGEKFENNQRNPFIWSKKFPFILSMFNNLTPFSFSGNSIKKEKDSKKVRDFFHQVSSGTEAKIDVLKRNSNLMNFTTINIVVPILIVTTAPISIPNLPVEKEQVKEENGVLYLFRPNVAPAINLWRIPIIVAKQENVLELIKNLFVVLISNISIPLKTFLERK